ncbi:MAG: primosomal protein N' [Candidatus Gracilibacteria bacterium]
MYYIVDLQRDQSKLSRYISNTLLEKIQETLNQGKKTIIYLNRRGEYSSLCCSDCAHLYKCKNCDVSLSVHKNPSKLICHMCGFIQDIDLRCEKCNGNNLQKVGVGTEQIERDLKKYFTKANIFRFDTDNIKTKGEKEKVLDNIKEADIIIGTKMITTGFDFADISLIAVVLLEQELAVPKYNIEEISYNNIRQLIGRGGRQGESKEVVIQTFISSNETIKSISEYNYKDFVTKTLEERKLFSYPPYADLAILESYDKNEEKSLNFCKILKNKLDLANEDKKVDINLGTKGFKKNGNYYHKIILKGEKLRDFLEIIRYEIIKNPKISLTFE